MLIRSGLTVAVFTFISRILGLIREIFIADMFGAGSMADCVNVAFKFPNLFRRIFGEGALASVFVPIFSNKLTESKKGAENFAAKVFWLLLILLSVLVILMQYYMPYMMFFIAPGFNKSPEKFNNAILLCRITAPYLVFISLSALIGGILNSVKQFWAFAFVPVLFNIFIIAGTVLIDNYTDKSIAICVAIILGGIGQIVFMYICMRNAGFNVNNNVFSTIKNSYYDSDIKKLMRLMVPATISSGALQLNIFISQSIASFISGAVSILSYAERIYQFPLSIIGIAFSTVLLPELSRLYKNGDKEKILVTQNNAIKFALVFSLPCTIGIMMLSEEIIYIIYQRGAFTSKDTVNTAACMSAFTLGLPAYILAKIFMPIFYANHDTKTPMKITLYSLTFNTVANIILMQFMAIGIALGSSIAAWLNCWMLVKYSHNCGYFSRDMELKSFILKLFVCCICMIVSICIINNLIAENYFHNHLSGKIFYLILIIISSASVYLAALFASGIINRNQIKSLLRK